MKPLALDLFCGGGGAAAGLQAAGFEVVGLDINPTCAKYYPGHFIQADISNGLLPISLERLGSGMGIAAVPAASAGDRGKPTAPTSPTSCTSPVHCYGVCQSQEA